LTDILGANNAGIFSVLVKPVNWTKDPYLITAIRQFENILAALFRAGSKWLLTAI